MGKLAMTSAGNKELREQILTLWRKEFPPRMNSDYMPEDLLNDLVDLITASNKQLLRELEGQKQENRNARIEELEWAEHNADDVNFSIRERINKLSNED